VSISLMYRATHDFKGEAERTLSLSADERFILLESSNKHWWKVKSSRDGRIGFAPANYLQLIENERDSQAPYRLKYDFNGTGALQLTCCRGDKVFLSSRKYQFLLCRRIRDRG
jgi:hypothetical protein